MLLTAMLQLLGREWVLHPQINETHQWLILKLCIKPQVCENDVVYLHIIWIHHFHGDSNAPCFTSQSFYITMVSRFSWVLQSSPFVSFWWGSGGDGGVNKVHHGLGENGQLPNYMFKHLSAEQQNSYICILPVLTRVRGKFLVVLGLGEWLALA